jgi:pimeloyl-ACP methyl ester carboxylesterase
MLYSYCMAFVYRRRMQVSSSTVAASGRCELIRPSISLLRSGDIIAVIGDFGDERAHLIGHSMRAWLAVEVAKYHPARLPSLVVGGLGPGEWPPPGTQGARELRVFHFTRLLICPTLNNFRRDVTFRRAVSS